MQEEVLEKREPFFQLPTTYLFSVLVRAAHCSATSVARELFVKDFTILAKLSNRSGDI